MNLKLPIGAAGLIEGRLALRRNEAAQVLGISVRTLERKAIDGTGPAFTKNGQVRLYPIKQLEKWLDASLTTSTAAAPRSGRRR